MKRLLWTSIRLKLTVATQLPLLVAIVICWVVGASIITNRFTSQALQIVSSNLNSAHEIVLADLSRLSDVIHLTAQYPELSAVLADQTLDSIIQSRTEYDYEFRKDYLGWHIHYHMGADEKRGLAKFIELLRKHGIGPVYEPKFVV